MKPSTKRSFIIGASFGLSMVLGVGILARAEEKEAAETFSKAPAAVQAAAKKALGDKKMEEFDQENVGGKTVYEVGYKVGDVDHAYLFSPAGDLIEEEADVELAKVPAAVTDAVKKAEPKAELKEAALATAGDKQYYAIDAKVGKEGHVIKVKADGTVISDDIEKTAGEKEDAKDKD